MTRLQWCALGLLTMSAPAAYADHEESLVYPISLAVVLFLAIGVVLVPWHRWWVRAITAVALLAGNVLLWREDMYARAHYDVNRMLTIMVVLPCAAAALCGWLFWKLVRRSHTA